MMNGRKFKEGWSSNLQIRVEVLVLTLEIVVLVALIILSSSPSCILLMKKVEKYICSDPYRVREQSILITSIDTYYSTIPKYFFVFLISIAIMYSTSRVGP
ncbi:hypothetical protein PanWU01x14_093570 [Parasponia andersonii]|uniref:Uncharacterized protein n=1 Tax=Parasponia andersonii TaxID=3476 RepID=A0A2P5D632_PARAD|nr:hypothetical protein PanWU01x14_093570 [Parasponia andersonii]